jgi:flagella basal body P-ring formation protein FlgA
MIRAAIALAIVVTLGSAVNAAQPRLKELVTVTGELVRIGDLVENAGAAADIAVFRAPDLGQTGAVPVARIADALRSHDLAGLDTQGLSEVIVTRLSRPITAKDIQDRIARAVAGQYGFGDAQNIGVVLDRAVRIMHVEAAAGTDLAVTRLHVDPRTGRFDIAFEIPGSAVARRLPLRFTGTVSETVETATLTRTLRVGEIVKASDVAMERRPKSEVGYEVMAADQTVGFAAKSALRAGIALKPDLLTRPQVVQRNEAVTILFELPGIMLTVRGKALEAGAVGDMVSVLNTQSNRAVQATVIGPGRVTIGAVTPVVARAATANDETEPRTE